MRGFIWEAGTREEASDTFLFDIPESARLGDSFFIDRTGYTHYRGEKVIADIRYPKRDTEAEFAEWAANV